MTLRQSFVKRLETVPAPARGPTIVGWTLVQDFARCDLLKQASAMAYVTLLSLVPSLVAIFCVLSVYTPFVAKGANLVDSVKGFVLTNLAAGSGDAVVDYLDKMLGSLDLKTIGWSSFGSVLITLVLLLRQIEEALNRIWLVHKGRNIFVRFMYFWTFLTLGMVLIGAMVGAFSGFDPKKILGAEAVAVQESAWTPRIVGTACAFLFFFFLYKVVPYCRVQTRNAALGAVAATISLMTASWGYTTYVIESKSYQTLYGALAQLPLFLMWLYICWIVILLGALLSWRLQEGFPREKDNEAIDYVSKPLDVLRNQQLRALMPFVALIAIYRNFQQGAGKGLSAQELAHVLRLPVSWIGVAVDALEELGYVVVSRSRGSDDSTSVSDPCFPALPAEQVKLTKLNADLARPSHDWMGEWQHDMPLDMPKALQVLRTMEIERNATLAHALERMPVSQAST